jgi:hypothetical protein
MMYLRGVLPMRGSVIRRAPDFLMLLVVAAGSPVRSAHAQMIIPLAADQWTATDSLRVENYLGRPSLYINRGVALARGVELRDGTIELDMATPKGGNFMGVAFHASTTDNSEVVFFRTYLSGRPDAMQYAPALNGVAAAWQIYNGDGANAAPTLAFDQWMHVRIEITGTVAAIYLNDEHDPALTVPRLAGVDGRSLGLWTGYYGRGAYYSNIRYTPREPSAPRPDAPLPRGTIVNWELSQMFDAASLTPGTLPPFSGLQWERVHVEAPGFVLVNRYRRMPSIGIPTDPSTHEPLVESIMRGQVAGSKVVFARTMIESDRAQLKRMLFGYSDGVVIYCNGQPLYFAMNPSGLRGQGIMDRIGDAVYLPLTKGRNEVVFAVTEFTGGWAYWARIDP